MCVAIRSRNQRSCEITTAQPAKLSNASSRARSVLTSKIVRWFVQQQYVGAFLQHLCQMDAIALAARQHRNFLLLIRTGEIEAAHVMRASSLRDCRASTHPSPPEISSQMDLSGSRVRL